MVRGIDAKDSADLRKKWGDKPCEHPGVLREYVRGSATGDYICVRCGEAGWGEDWVEKEKPEEKMDNKLLIHVSKTSDAVNTLVKLKHTESALILLYSWIDRMAWLSVPNQESNGGDFKRWVEIYLFEETSLPCTSDDLWSARCALLHTGSSESRDTSKGNARTVWYYGGDEADFTSNEDDKVFLKISDLHCGLISATTRFNKHLNENPSERAIAEKKLGKILTRTELVAG